MKKSDLKNMMIVELRDGARYVVVGDRIYGTTSYYPLSAFTNELKHINRGCNNLDIVRVYAPIDYIPSADTLNSIETICTLEWEREDDLDLPFNGKAVFTGDNVLISTGLTIGKVYIILDGKFPDDNGNTRPLLTPPYLTESTLKSFGLLKLIE